MTTKQGANVMRVIAIKLSKTNPPKKQQKQGVKIFLQKMFRCRNEPIKRMERRP